MVGERVTQGGVAAVEGTLQNRTMELGERLLAFIQSPQLRASAAARAGTYCAAQIRLSSLSS